MQITAKFLKQACAAAAIALASAASNAACVLTDFTYRGDAADNCTGPISGNDKAKDLNDANTFGTNTWQFLAKYNDGGQTEGGTFTIPNVGSISFSVIYDGLVDNWHQYQLVANDSPDTVLPAIMDLIGVTKQGNEKEDGGYIAYFFDNVLVGDSGNIGTFRMAHGPGNPENNDFSHFSFYGANYVPCSPTNPVCDDPTPPDEVPEPGSLALVGLALGALGLRRRFGRKA